MRCAPAESGRRTEGGAAAAGKAPWGTLARAVDDGYVINGKKIFASLAGAADLFSRLAEMAADRMTPILAIGGGVVGDLAGFVHRGGGQQECCGGEKGK